MLERGGESGYEPIQRRNAAGPFHGAALAAAVGVAVAVCHNQRAMTMIAITLNLLAEEQLAQEARARTGQTVHCRWSEC